MTLLLTQGNALKIPLADESVHCCITSPPYWGLRSYSGEQSQVWGGDPDCVHEWGNDVVKPSNVWGTPNKNSEPGTGSHGIGGGENVSIVGDTASNFCLHCAHA
jgi:hypothetical protein